jgi:hypothetical protein
LLHFNPFTHCAFDVAHLTTELKIAVGRSGWGRRGGGPRYVATEKNAKIAEVHSITSRFGMKTWLKLNCLQKFTKRTRTKLSIAIENFIISQVEKEIELPKVRLKSENQKIILHKIDHNFVKNSLILFYLHF